MTDDLPPLPHNREAERSILGAILLDNHALMTAVENLRSQDFFLPQHRRIFERMVQLSENQEAIDPVTLMEDLNRRGELEAVGGIAYLSQLAAGLPRVTNVKHYARIVVEKAALRDLIHVGSAIQEQAFSATQDANVVLDRALASISSLRHTVGKNESFRLIPSEDFLRRDSEEERDWLVPGLFPARSQTIWQGRPKVGKSHTLLQLGFDLASGLPVFGRFSVRQPARVAFFELEEGEATTKDRFSGMLRAHDGQGPEQGYLSFFSISELHRWKLLSRELLGIRRRQLCAAIRDVGAELVIFIALRKLVTGDTNDPQVAEVFNDALDTLAQETGAALSLGHHDRKAHAATAEARGLGSTMFSARADAIFDLSRAHDSSLRRVQIEGRYAAPEEFWLRKEIVGDGELIRVVDAPSDMRGDKQQAVRQRVNQGVSVRQAGKAEGVPYSTARRWVSEAD
jgi:replicative DNA helicase